MGPGLRGDDEQLMTTPDELKRITGTLVLAGAGKMGGAMLSGWLAKGLDPKRVVVIEPHPSDETRDFAAKGVKLNQAATDIGAIDVLVVAVKPQMVAEVLPQLKALVGSSTLVISIMAGVTVSVIGTIGSKAVVRAMPNTPAAIGRGISVAVAGAGVNQSQRDIADALLRATGSVEWIGDESLMDAVTAVSGSGPAYIFLLAEELARAGVAAGLPEALATKLARETVSGSGELLRRSELTSATLRENVTSPGGTTAAALEVLMGDGGFQSLLTRAVAAATKRSKELSK